MTTRSALFVRAAAAVLLVVCVASAAEAIPAFARRYGVSCQQCHHPIPKLTAFGQMFAGHGYRMVSGEAPIDTIDTGDDMLSLPRHLPIAVRVDGGVRLDFDSERSALDFESPLVVKLLSSAALSKDLSYYFYFLVSERGEVAGVEDAFLYWNDMAGWPVDFAVGQFQVSDPMFKRELRLPFEDYVVYGTRVGSQSANLTYDRGALVAADVAGFTGTFEVVNGNGLQGESGSGGFDGDAFKNCFWHVTRDVAPGLRLGTFWYLGWQRVASSTLGSRRNELRMSGTNATLRLGALELNGQYVRRVDKHPMFRVVEPLSRVDGGFVEALWLPEGQRWYGLAIWNRVVGSLPLLDFGQGAPELGRIHESGAVGGGYLVRRNLRLSGEVGWDFRRDTGRARSGMTLGY